MIPPAVAQRLRQMTATPQRRVAVMAVVATVVGLGLGAALWPGRAWTTYELAGTGLAAELPAPPEATLAGSAEEKVPLFQVRCPDMVVVASGGSVPAGATPDAEFLARQAMAQVQLTAGITELDYRLGRESLNGQRCLMVGGTFRRNGVASRLSGAFFVTPTGHGHIICFWTERKGARMASRVLQSVRLSP